MKLLLNLVWKDYERNKVITIVLVIFLILSFLLMAGGLRVAGTMLSSMRGLNELAMPPEYLQMHKGAYDKEAFNDFLGTRGYIKDSMIVEMLNISNANIRYEGGTLENCLMDNGLVIQNDRFDFLLDMDNEIAVVKEGEIGVPVYYVEELGIKVGDIITICEDDYRKELIVSEIIRDASMNAALTSSKRFLVSPTDLNEISFHMGDWEYCFEFLLEDGTNPSVLETDYIDAGMPSNGVAVTGKLLILLNNLSYGLIAFIIMVISILLIFISSLCLSYIIRATMAEESHVIGEMKAIGFSGNAIEKLYHIKYISLILIAAVVGYLSAIPFGDFFSSSVIMYCGYGTDEWMKWLFPLLGAILLALIVIITCRRIIRKNLRYSVTELIRGELNKKEEGHYTLPSKGLKHVNLTIAFGELKCKWKEYFVIFMVFVLSSFLILLPINMKYTAENPSFITYMGVGQSDIRIDIQYSDKLTDQKDAVITYLENDSEIEKYEVYRNGYVQFLNEDGKWEYIRVENGDTSVFPLEFLEGRAPNDSNEIALSYLNASELGKEIGDSMKVVYQGKELLFTVCGIYQDITYGGKTAKAAIDFDEKDVEVYIIYLNISDDVGIGEKANELRSMLTDSKITPINEFVSQTLGAVTNNMSLISVTAIAVSLLLIIIVTAMILQLITAREHSSVAIKKAIGFSNRDIRIQLGIRILTIQIGSIIIGTCLANLLGEVIFSLILSSMGASKITLLVEPFTAYLLCPAVQLLAVFITVIVGTRVIKKYHIRDQIVE